MINPIHPILKIHMASAIVIRVVNKETASKWKRSTHRREYKYGNTTVRVHTDLFLLTEDQQKEWFRIETERKNPVIMGIKEAIRNCYR